MSEIWQKRLDILVPTLVFILMAFLIILTKLG